MRPFRSIFFQVTKALTDLRNPHLHFADGLIDARRLMRGASVQDSIVVPASTNSQARLWRGMLGSLLYCLPHLPCHDDGGGGLLQLAKVRLDKCFHLVPSCRCSC
jgi:hypothetical protein